MSNLLKENNYEKRLLNLKEKLNKIICEERKPLQKDSFSILLAGIQSYMCKIGPFDFNIELTQEDLKSLKEHIKKAYGITDRTSALYKLADNKNNGCGRQYVQFLSFWNDNPEFDINKLSKEAAAAFSSCKDFAHNFYNVVGEKGFTAWDIGESIGLVRDCYICGYLEKELCDTIIEDFSDMALRIYRSFEEYAISYICGGCYYMYRKTGNEEICSQVFDKLYDAVNELFFNEKVNVFAKYKWL
ncbi:MAG: DUF1266 domain-containing protein [Clostridium sp.]